MSKILEKAREIIEIPGTLYGRNYIFAALDRLEKLEKAINAHKEIVSGLGTLGSVDVELWDALKED